jgi:hypothetical protein
MYNKINTAVGFKRLKTGTTASVAGLYWQDRIQRNLLAHLVSGVSANSQPFYPD